MNKTKKFVNEDTYNPEQLLDEATISSEGAWDAQSGKPELDRTNETLGQLTRKIGEYAMPVHIFDETFYNGSDADIEDMKAEMDRVSRPIPVSGQSRAQKIQVRVGDKGFLVGSDIWGFVDKLKHEVGAKRRNHNVTYIASHPKYEHQKSKKPYNIEEDDESLIG